MPLPISTKEALLDTTSRSGTLSQKNFDRYVLVQFVWVEYSYQSEPHLHANFRKRMDIIVVSNLQCIEKSQAYP